MQTLEKKKIVISLPKLTRKSLLTLLAVFLAVLTFTYWIRNVHPYLSLSNAYLNAYSTLISSDVQGRIVEMGPQEGDRVEQGELLFAFDREPLLTKQEQLKASFDLLHRQIDLERERMTKAMDGYVAAANNLDLGEVGSEEVQRQLGIMENAQTKAEEALGKANALATELHLLERELKKGAFFAPFKGVILKRYKNEGAVILLGEPVYSLCDPERIWIEAEIPETKIHKIALGTPAKIRISAYPNKEWVGKVSYIGSATNAKSDHLPLTSQMGTVPVKISFEKPDFALKPGLFAKVDLKVN